MIRVTVECKKNLYYILGLRESIPEQIWKGAPVSRAGVQNLLKMYLQPTGWQRSLLVGLSHHGLWSLECRWSAVRMQTSLSQGTDAQAHRGSGVSTANPPGHKEGYSQWPGTQSCRGTEGVDVAGSLQCVEGLWDPNLGKAHDQRESRAHGVQVEMAAGKSSPGQARPEL